MKQNWKEQVQWILDDAVAQGDLPGASVKILQHGEELLFAASGYADREAKIPYKKDTIVRLYSMSKPVTAVAMMILLERGMIDLWDPVERYLPGFANGKVFQAGSNALEPAWRAMTIHNLLCMEAGLAYPGMEDAAGLAANAVFEEIDRRLYTDQAMTTIEIANALGQLPLAFQPGTHCRYSTCADVAGAIVEVVSGMKFGEFLQKELFRPLGLTDMDFYVPEEKQDRLAKAYEMQDGEYKETKTNHLGLRYMREVPPAFESGGAGLVGTIEDYARFATMVLRGGELDGVRILQPKTVKFMASGQLREASRKDLHIWAGDRLRGYDYGCFHRVLREPNQAMSMCNAGEFGWDGWLGTYYLNDPTSDITIILFTQRSGVNNTRTVRRISNVVFSAFSEE